ncbi:MAG: hypothetical protein JNM75_13920 [Rhodospirillales bacterium]|nr:hypothetical protein [Rhodospirillales bacterium]
MSKSIARSLSTARCFGPALAAHNDRRLGHRQARARRPSAPSLAAGVLVAVVFAMMLPLPAPGATEAPAKQTAPLEIERERIDGRLDTIERKQEDRGSRLVPVAPIRTNDRNGPLPPTGVRALDPLRSDSRRLDLERRGLEQRRQGIDRDLDRAGGNVSPSSGNLLDRLRND